MGFDKGVLRKHVLSSRVTKDTLGEGCGMAVCQTALALPRVGMESIYTPALVFAEKKGKEGKKENVLLL